MKILVLIILFTLYSPVYNSLILEDEQIKAYCAQKICIRKCCKKNQYVNLNSSCEDFDQDYDFDFSIIPVYSEINPEHKINKTIHDLFHLVPGRFQEKLKEKEFNCSTFLGQAFIAADYSMNNVLLENGIMYMELPNWYDRWNPVTHFCVDLYNDSNTITPKIWSVVSTDGVPTTNSYFTVALLVSIFFLFLVLLVYILLPELRNLRGLVLMAYVFSLMGAFIFLVTIQLEEFGVNGCITMTAITYFFFLATFCWMNVMSYDIWWTFRAKARQIHRRGEKFKFCMYCIYAWGVPLLMAIMLVIINNMDFSDKPWFVTPQIPTAGCFLEGGQKFVYLYIPMLIMILCNWFFFLMTAFNIWHLSRGTAAVNSDSTSNPAAHHSKRNRLMIYLKLSLIMGINWVLEVISYFSPDLKVWKITDMYNLLLGLAIFLIFVCKKSIYKKLCNSGYAKAQQIHKQGEKFKFCMYFNVAWGVPLLMAIMLVIINNMYFSDKPWIVTPQIPTAGSFLEGGQKLVYLYIPMLIMILCNWFFFLMTAFNIWRLSRGTAAVNSDSTSNPAAHRSKRNRLMIYLKLSLIMGINWVLEVISYFSPDLKVWKITDMYNLLLGLAIFLIFVCKKSIYKKLCNSGYAKAQQIHKQGEKFKFCMYFNVAWGVPLLMAIMLVIINNMYFSDKPWLVTPQIPTAGCFLEGGQKLVYLYIPMLIMIMYNWFFSLMTAFNIWRLSRGTAAVNLDAAGNPDAHRSKRYRPMIHLKLSLIMGINCLLEVISYFSPDLKVWITTDMYNFRLGLIMFLILVCQKSIYKKLCNRCREEHFSKPHLSSSTLESNISQETPLETSSGLKSKCREEHFSKPHLSSSTLESNISQETPLHISTHPIGQGFLKWGPRTPRGSVTCASGVRSSLDSDRQMEIATRTHLVKKEMLKEEGVEFRETWFKKNLKSLLIKEMKQRARRFTQFNTELDEFTKKCEDELQKWEELEKNLADQDIENILLMVEREEKYQQEMTERVNKFLTRRKGDLEWLRLKKFLANRAEEKRKKLMQDEQNKMQADAQRVLHYYVQESAAAAADKKGTKK